MKRLLFLFGVLTGILIMEVFRRQQLEDLAELKFQKEKIRKHNEERLQDFEAFYKTLPIEEQIDIAVREAEWKLDHDDN
jgi:hypothetical protein